MARNIQTRRVECIGSDDCAAENMGPSSRDRQALPESSKAFSHSVALLRRVMAATATYPGRRLRGVLMLILRARLGVFSPTVLEAACAAELIPNASLVIDDLTDINGALTRLPHHACRTWRGTGDSEGYRADSDTLSHSFPSDVRKWWSAGGSCQYPGRGDRPCGVMKRAGFESAQRKAGGGLEDRQGGCQSSSSRRASGPPRCHCVQQSP